MKKTTKVECDAKRINAETIEIGYRGNSLLYLVHGRSADTINTKTDLSIPLPSMKPLTVKIYVRYNPNNHEVTMLIPRNDIKKGDKKSKSHYSVHCTLDGVNRSFANAVGAIETRRGDASEQPEDKPQKVVISESACWDMFFSVVKHVDRLLLYGPPGTGKTTGAVRDCKKGYYMVTLHEDSSVAEMLGHWIPQGDKFIWHDGVAIRAWKEGKPLIINEVDLASGPVMTFLHSILDDKELAHQTLPNGETVHRQEGFKCIATMNGRPEDLSGALADRFEVSLDIDKPSKAAIEALPEDLREPLVSLYSNKDDVKITYREIVAFSILRKQIGDNAYEIIFKENHKDFKDLLKLGRRAA